MSPSPSTRRTPAFTLAEVLVFVAILAIAVLGLLSTQTYALRCSQYNRLRHVASTVLNSELSECEAVLRSDFSADPSHPRAAVSDHPELSSVARVLYEPADASDPTLKKITAAVYWTDPGASQESVATAWTYVYLSP